jgi:hypothetical protein
MYLQIGLKCILKRRERSGVELNGAGSEQRLPSVDLESSVSICLIDHVTVSFRSKFCLVHVL